MSDRPADDITARMHLDPRHWPEDIEGGKDVQSIKAWRLREAAEKAFEEFQAERDRIVSDGNLSPQGRRNALAELAAGLAEPLLQGRAEAMERAEEARRSMNDALVRPLKEVPDTPAAIAQQQEIRSHIKSLPAAKRLSAVLAAAEKGDRSMLRAALSAPAYLSGLDEAMLGRLTEFVAQKDNPALAARMTSLDKAFGAADRAADGVLRFMRTEASKARGPQVVTDSFGRPKRTIGTAA